MRQFLLLALAWTAVVAALLLLWPSGVNTPGCMQLITPADCLAQATVMNDRLLWTQTLPMLVFIASGSVVVGALAYRRLRSPRH